MKNKNLHEAKQNKNDEFYTQLTDIENELKHYKKHFKNKIIFCNCDDPYESNFFKYFAANFNNFGLKKLIATCFNGSQMAGRQLSLFDMKGLNIKEKKAFKIEINKVEDYNKDSAIDLLDVEWLLKNDKNTATLLKQNGDFRSDECIELLKKCDIVVTNPPFSLFREFINILDKHNKKFLIIGSKNAITYKEVFKLIKDNKLWLGHRSPDGFIQPDDVKKKELKGLTYWFTNLKHNKLNERLILYKKYNEKEYPKYDNYNAININKTKDIPMDYDGLMGVPITFLEKYNPEQFEIVGNADDKDFYIPMFGKYEGRITINGVQPFKRIIIKKVK